MSTLSLMRYTCISIYIAYMFQFVSKRGVTCFNIVSKQVKHEALSI